LFERSTQRVRRSIFFARYESSQFGSPEITSAELLLGVLREDKTVAAQLGGFRTLAAIRKEVEQLAPKRPSNATSVGKPLSHESKRALAFAAEEAERLNHQQIDSSHLVLGLLREEDSLAAKLLRKYGMTLERCREIARQALPASPPSERVVVFERREPAPVVGPDTSLGAAIYDLRQLVDSTEARLRGYADPYGDRRLHGKSWSRKEALGHLIDWAIVHERWVTQVLTGSKLIAAAYPDEAAVAVQHYAGFPWPEIVDLWVLLNRLLIHVLARVPEEKLEAPCHVGTADPVPLSKLVEIYIEHCADIAAQILAPLD
jgi:Clp amino terminal domain, pathogenicity island component/DinB superfamily